MERTLKNQGKCGDNMAEPGRTWREPSRNREKMIITQQIKKEHGEHLENQMDTGRACRTWTEPRRHKRNMGGTR